MTAMARGAAAAARTHPRRAQSASGDVGRTRRPLFTAAVVVGACLVAATMLPFAAADEVGGNGTVTAQFRRCPGQYCGRTRSSTSSEEWSPCGPCPRGHRAVDGRCTECTGTVDAYGAAFLAFDAAVLCLAHVLVRTLLGQRPETPGVHRALCRCHSVSGLVRRQTQSGQCAGAAGPLLPSTCAPARSDSNSAPPLLQCRDCVSRAAITVCACTHHALTLTHTLTLCACTHHCCAHTCARSGCFFSCLS